MDIIESDKEEETNMDDDVETDDSFTTAFGRQPILDNLVSNLSEFQSLDCLLKNDVKSENETKLGEPISDITIAQSVGVDIISVTNEKIIDDEFFNIQDNETETESIKLEFTCESEQIVDNNYDDEYFVVDDEDGTKKGESTLNDDNCLQVEVYATDTNDEDVENNDGKNALLDNYNSSRVSDLEENVNPLRANEQNTITNEQVVKCDKHDDNSDLSNIMSDHNYTSQEIASELNAADADTLRHNLVNHILNKNTNCLGKLQSSQSSNSNSSTTAANNVNTAIFDFVDTILESINKFDAVKSSKSDKKQPPDCPITDFNYDDDRDLFVQNIMDAVVAEDAEEEEKEKYTILSSSSTSSSSYSSNKLKNEPVNTEDGKVEKENTEKSNDVKLDESYSNIPSPNIESNKTKGEQDAEERDIISKDQINQTIVDPLPSSPSLLENCSEPMEHEVLDEVFGTTAFDIKTTKKTNSAILEKLSSFSKALYDDCCQFASASSCIEDKLQIYINVQFLKFKTMVKTEMLLSDQAVQTDRRISTRKLQKLNSKNKKVLLASSEDDSSLDDSSSNDESMISTINTVKEVAGDVKLEKSVEKSVTTSTSTSSNNQIKLNFASEYDDGVPLTQYIQSEVFETETFSNQSLMSPQRDHHSDIKSNEFLDEKLKIGNKVINLSTDSDTKSDRRLVHDKTSQSESDKENGIQKPKFKNKQDNGHDEDDENDKEIERLINLDGLTKRPIYVGSTKSAETDKTKTKSQSKINKNSITEYSEDDIQKDVGSDESISESDEEIITEKQYLARCNENLKHQLLNASSSDSEELEYSDDELVERLDSDENGNSSPLIDTFLKNFNADESDEEPKESCDTSLQEQQETTNGNAALPSITANTSEGGEKYKDKDEESIVRHSGEELEDIKPSDLLSDNSDCELLNDNLLFRKRSRPKSLEKMLNAADRRKKANKVDEDLISLSSESDCSDVEAVDVEPEPEASKSRLLKPMLRQDQLASETRKAQKHENDRIRRLEKKQTMLTRVLKEHSVVKKSGELVLDYIEETKTLIKVHPDIVKHLKPHQVDGVKFMYDSCYGGVEALKKNSGSGCILAHCMGLGKTLQLIALLHTVITYKELKTTKILVLCPKSTVMNWADEIRRWLGPLNQRNLKVYTFNDTSDINEKLGVMREWSFSAQNRAGCLLIGYEAFRTLVFYHSYKNRGNVSTARLEDIREKVDKYLLQPGADLVVCDEGHIIKNSKSAISLAVSKIITPKRIVLTGTPIQNNLKEYYSMVNFIKPLFLGTEKEFANLYANPIKNGQHKDSSKRDIKVMKQRSFVLHKKLSKFVQRKEAELLKTFLPQKFEYVLFIPMTVAQNNLYEYILDAISRREENRGRSLITDYTCLRKIWTHPKVLEDAWKNATNQKFKRDARKISNQIPHSDDDQPDDIYDSQTGVMSVTNDWWRHLLTEKDLETILPSNKLRAMFEILRMCEEKGEKCLIFSAFVAVLNVVEYFFKKITNLNPDTLQELNFSPNKIKNTWISGQDYYRLDGKTPKSIRHEMIKRFNSALNKRARVFLISAKAGGQGINLIGANRVIILDTSWNPSNDQQNIFRIFRLGQKKNCYIYRLLAMGTMEEKVYSRSVTKQAMSFRVVDEQQIDRHYNMAELAELYILTVPNYSERPMPIFPQDSILASMLLNFPELVYKYHEHDSLLENKVEQELSEAEKADAWAAYERDLQLNSEIREMPNVEDMQNNFAAAKMQNYFGSLSGLDMQTLMNYGSLGQQAASSPFMQSLLAQYNYPASNQQYMEMLNLYRKFTQSTLGYPDMNTSIADSAAFNASAYTMNAPPPPKSMPNIPTNAAAAAAMLSGLQHHANSATATNSNPLSALGDLSMYGIGASTKNLHAPSINSSSVGGMFPSPSTSSSPAVSSSNMHTSNANAMFGHYKQSLESTFHNLFQYTNEYHASSGQNPAKHKLSNSTSTQHLNQYMDATNAAAAASGSYPISTHLSPPPLTSSSSSGTAAASSSIKSHNPQQEQQKSTFLNPVLNNLTETQQKKPPLLQQNDANKSGISSSTRNTSGDGGSDIIPMSVIRKNDVPTPLHSLANKVSKTSIAAIANNLSSKAPASSESRNSPNQLSSARPASAMVQKRSIQTLPSASSTSTSKTQTPKTTPVQTINLAPKPNDPPSIKTTTVTVTNEAHRTSLNMGILYPKSSDSLSAPSTNTTSVSSVNMGIVYPTANLTTSATSTTSGSSAANLIKVSNSSEMQIIPTTSPPGTTSISKQFNEISPSISLMAVRNSSSGVKMMSTAQKPQPPSTNQSSLLLSNSNNINKSYKSTENRISTNSSLTPTTTDILNTVKINLPVHLNRAKQTIASNAVITNARPATTTLSSSSSTSTSSTASLSSSASAIAKTAAAAAVLAKSTTVSSATMKNNFTNLSPVIAASQGNQPTPPAATTIKKTAVRRPQVVVAAQVSAVSTQHLFNRSTPTTSPSLYTAAPSIMSKTPLGTASVRPLSKANAVATLAVASGAKRSSPITASSSAFIIAAQKQRNAPTATSSPAVVKSTLNIRPVVDSKQNPSGTGVYIIETNINEKRVAIGAPTKSGGGTTVTKVAALQKKRKVQESFPKDISFKQTKQQRLGE